MKKLLTLILAVFLMGVVAAYADSGDNLLLGTAAPTKGGKVDLLQDSGPHQSGNDLLEVTAAQSNGGKVDLLQDPGPHASGDDLLEGSAAQPGGKVDLLKNAPAPTDSKVDPALCQMLVKHTPSADTNYQPGVDAHGNPVAPADLPGQAQIKMPDKINIPITISLAKALNLNTSTYPGSVLGPGTESTIGVFSIEGDQVSFNGQPLSDAQQDNLAVLCMKPH